HGTAPERHRRRAPVHLRRMKHSARHLKAALREGARAARRALRDGPVTPAPAAPPPAATEIDYARVEAIVRVVADEVYNRNWSMAHQLRNASAVESARFVFEHIPLQLGKDHYALRRDAVLAGAG